VIAPRWGTTMPPTPSTGPGHSEHKALLKNAEVMQLVAVSVETGGSNFQHYKKGVYNGPCRTKPNHTVTIVGMTNRAGTSTGSSRTRGEMSRATRATSR
jgi:hypothetical protein